MFRLDPQNPLFLEVHKRALPASVGQLLVGGILAYEVGPRVISENAFLSLIFSIIFLGPILRLGAAVAIDYKIENSLPISKRNELAVGIGSMLAAFGFMLLATSLYIMFGFFNIGTVLSLVTIAATSAGASTSLGASRWISQGYLFCGPFLTAIFFTVYDDTARALGFMTFLYYGYLAHYTEIYRQQLGQSTRQRIDLASQRERLRHFVDSIPKKLALLDSDLRYVSVNSLHGKLLNASEDELVGKSILAHDPFYEVAQALALSETDTQISKKAEIHTCDGKRWHAIKLRKLEGSNEIVCFAQDIHNETILEEAQRESHGRMVQSAKMASLGEMAGGISHEINNPLAIIVGKTDLLLDRLNRGPVATEILIKDLAKLKDTAFRISKIIRGLRAFARSGENDPFSRSMMTPLVEDSLELCRERFRHSSVDLRIDLTADAQIACRPSQISQVVLNLLNNAFDAVQGNEGAWIEIKTEVIGPRAMIVVTDSGPGIPVEVASRLMEPFFTTKPVNKGTGLGLSISKGLIEDHKGTLTYDSTSPNTRFVVEFKSTAYSEQVAA